LSLSSVSESPEVDATSALSARSIAKKLSSKFCTSYSRFLSVGGMYGGYTAWQLQYQQSSFPDDLK
jgi:hypothetical protein